MEYRNSQKLRERAGKIKGKRGDQRGQQSMKTSSAIEGEILEMRESGKMRVSKMAPKGSGGGDGVDTASAIEGEIL